MKRLRLILAALAAMTVFGAMPAKSETLMYQGEAWGRTHLAQITWVNDSNIMFEVDLSASTTGMVIGSGQRSAHAGPLPASRGATGNWHIQVNDRSYYDLRGDKDTLCGTFFSGVPPSSRKDDFCFRRVVQGQQAAQGPQR